MGCLHGVSVLQANHRKVAFTRRLSNQPNDFGELGHGFGIVALDDEAIADHRDGDRRFLLFAALLVARIDERLGSGDQSRVEQRGRNKRLLLGWFLGRFLRLGRLRPAEQVRQLPSLMSFGA